MRTNRYGAGSSGGSTLVTATVGVAVMAGMAAGIMIVSTSSNRELENDMQVSRSIYVAQAGISDALSQAASSFMLKEPLPSSIGTIGEPMKMGGGDYWTSVTENPDGTVTIRSTGNSSGKMRAIEVIARPTAGGAFANALYSGNSSEDPTYVMQFGGTGAQADQINGNIYSGNDIQFSGSAAITGTAAAGGSVLGMGGQGGQSQPPVDLAAADFPVNHDVDVLREFQTGGATYKSDGSGGSAWQLSESNPAHIFRANASDRKPEYQGTQKHDFFLEDPYESASASNINGTSATKITLSGATGKPGQDTSNAVFFIDGNLWLHNKKTKDFMFYDAGGKRIAVTFAVSGNIYFSDNLHYQDMEQNGMAFIAIKDTQVADSGNIYFGDPVFGTLDRMDAFMYAENNFHDINLDATGSAKITVNGNMSCGNQFVVQRDVGTQHTKLTVNYDGRMIGGDLTLPGVPLQEASARAFQPISWREVPLDEAAKTMQKSAYQHGGTTTPPHGQD